jgi:BirA family biotin operon repressor/biotin-[acetyl-CoA-carboxylase] ligase
MTCTKQYRHGLQEIIRSIKTEQSMTKDEVYSILKNSEGYVSGEKISSQLGVTRAAVNTAVKTLRKEGYEIASTTNKGYLLVSSPDRLTSADIMSYLGPERMQTVQVLQTTDSTNRRAAELAMNGAPDGLTVIANEQSAGRGRLGRSFHSPKDTGIYFSVLLRPTCKPAEIVQITTWTAVAIAKAVERATGMRPDIKWVNDLLMGGRKICGILTEMSVESETGTIQYVVAGIGVNVNQEPSDFPEELRGIAGSIAMAAGHPVQRARLAACMIEEMDNLRKAWPSGREDYLKAYREMCISTGRDVLVTDARHTGEFAKHGFCEAVNDDFSLRIRYEDGSYENVSSGEVSVKPQK